MSIFNGTNGNDNFNGGSGSDTVTFSGKSSGYRMDLAGGVRVVDIDFSDGDTGTDLLSGIETLAFADKSYSLSIELGPGGETQVDTYVDGRQFEPAITALADGGYVVAWGNWGEDADGIRLQRFDANGAAVGPETAVSNEIDVYGPAITALVGGGYVVSWVDYQGGSLDVYARRYQADGVAAGVATRVNTFTSDHQERPAITALADGGYLIAWESLGQEGFLVSGIYAQRFNAGGVAVGAETRISTNPADSPAITTLTDGGYVISWSGNGTGDTSGIYAQRFDAGGVALGVETRINTFTTGVQSESAITALADGGYVITWQSAGQDGSELGVYAQRFNSSGAAVGAETRINTNAEQDQDEPAIAGLADGGYVIAWQSDTENGTHEIFAQRFAADGAAVGAETRINTYTGTWQSNPAVTALADGGFIITWEGSNGDTTLFAGIFSQRFSADGQRLANGLTISGSSGNDVLSGGVGALTLKGLGGNDTYLLFQQADAVVERAGEGIDTVQATFSYTLGENVENLILASDFSMDGTGNALNNILTGNHGRNILKGLGGDDTLDGGETGQNQLIGGLGNDTYIFHFSDSITEHAGQGTDIVKASVSYALGANLENLTLTGAGDINGTGNTLNNIITGNSVNNILNGGAGLDHLRGGLGNDYYALFDNDTITENAGQGTDTVWAGFSYALGANLENLTLTGSANINGTGNMLNNVLVGNSGNNVLSGGAGNDTYVLLSGNDAIVENAGQGTDTVRAALSFVLSANLENLTLTGSANIKGAGNMLNNIVTGNAGNNVLNGGGGKDMLAGGAGVDQLRGGQGNDILIGGVGSDRLTGGAGKDAFRFTRSENGVETITDYRGADDRIEFAIPALKKVIGAGPLDSSFFHASASGKAVDGSDFFLYETDTGKLFFDRDGSGGAPKVLFAIIGTSTHPAMTASEFVVV